MEEQVLTELFRVPRKFKLLEQWKMLLPMQLYVQFRLYMSIHLNNQNVNWKYLEKTLCQFKSNSSVNQSTVYKEPHCNEIKQLQLLS